MTDTDAQHARLRAVADGLMDGVAGFTGWRGKPPAVAHRDAILAAIKAERVRGEASMRERAATVAKEHSPVLVGDTDDGDTIAIEDAEAIVSRVGEVIAAAIRALPTTDQETTHG